MTQTGTHEITSIPIYLGLLCVQSCFELLKATLRLMTAFCQKQWCSLKMNFIEEIIFLQFHLGLNLPLNFFEQKEKNWVLSLNRSYHLKRNQKWTLITWIKITLTSTMGAFPIMPPHFFSVSQQWRKSAGTIVHSRYHESIEKCIKEGKSLFRFC